MEVNPVEPLERILRDDLYRRPLLTALQRLGLGAGWTCVDVGAGQGDVAVALAEVVGASGRIYALDADPKTRDEVATRAAKFSQVIALTQAAEELTLPEEVDLAYCRFLLLHVVDPALAIASMARAVRKGGWLLLQEPITGAGRIDGEPFFMPSALHPDIGALIPRLVIDAGLELVDAWAEGPAGCGPGPVADYLEAMSEVSPGMDPVILPPLVTVLARKP